MADRTHSERINFGKLREVIQPPNLIELQISSYLEFLQKEVPEKQRKPYGLEAVFKEVFPINSYDERLTLEYVSYTIGEPKSSEIECLREGTTYAVPLYVKLPKARRGGRWASTALKWRCANWFSPMAGFCPARRSS